MLSALENLARAAVPECERDVIGRIDLQHVVHAFAADSTVRVIRVKKATVARWF